MALNPHSDNGLLCRALALSLLLHSVLLLQPGLGSTVSESRAARMLNAMLKPQTTIPAKKAKASAPSRRSAAAPERSHADIAPSAEAIATPDAAPRAHPEPADNAAGNISDESSEPVIRAVVTDPAPGLDIAEAKKSYLFAIAAEARRVKKYPPRAFAAGWSGTAEILVAVAAGGEVQTPRLSKSSGYADIDNAALSFVGVALNRTAVPKPLRMREFEFLVPVTFTIAEP